MAGDAIVQRAAAVIHQGIFRRRSSEEIAETLHDAGLLAEPKESYGEQFGRVLDVSDQDRFAETWRLRGEFIDALARAYANWNRTAGALVAHLDGGES